VLRKFLWFFILLPVGVLLVALAVANRHAVSVILDPFSPAAPALAFEMPLFLLLFATLALGLVIGGMVTWFGQRRWRRAAKRRGVEAAGLRREREQLSRQLELANRPKIAGATAELPR
jgi:uncharacterized integral membrane protein